MDVNQIIEQISIEDMPSDDMKLVAKHCGVDVAIKIMQKMGGLGIYVPKNPFALVVERILRQERNPDFKEIATICSVTERYVRNIWRKLNAGNNRQHDLFDKHEN